MLKAIKITPKNTEFVVISFEGPDKYYSQAGGLGVRVSELTQALASKGFTTHVIFIGDPKKPGEECLQEGRLILHRWSQWISDYYPIGVYQGESEKLYDFNETVPTFVMNDIVKPAVERKKLVVIMGEEWHTAAAMINTSDILHYNGLRDKVLMLWNANHTMSFHRIDWGRLNYTTTITTVSKYMKHCMWGLGVNPMVIPNGIPKRMLEEHDHELYKEFRTIFPSDLVLFKIGRWDPDKRWNMAVEAVACLKRIGVSTTFLIRGGKEPYEGEVVHNAKKLGLMVKEVRVKEPDIKNSLDAFRRALPADILNLKFYLSEDLLRLIYRGSDAVLANSGREPFGLVGLEVMAARGVAITGSTGEDYVTPFQNAIVLETDDPRELVQYLLFLKEHPNEEKRIRREARITAKQYSWDEILKNLIYRLEFIAFTKNIQMGENPHGQ